jgi:nucleotide-binding universal stress UspA family protein
MPYTEGLPLPVEEIGQLVRAKLDQFVDKTRVRYGKCEGAVEAGFAWERILDRAAKSDADLIVMGTHGRGGMAHVLLGSVAERVVRTAHCSVLTLRDRPDRTVRQVLVPTDFSATADAALDCAFVLAARLGADLQLLHVVDDPFLAEGMAAEAYIAEAPTVRTAMLRDAQARLKHRSSWPGVDVTVHTEVVFGHNAKTIAEYAAMRNIDLIVMGTHGRTGVAHLLLGSVAERLVRTAPCPVLTVRQTPRTKAYAELVYDVDHLPA